MTENNFGDRVTVREALNKVDDLSKEMMPLIRETALDVKLMREQMMRVVRDSERHESDISFLRREVETIKDRFTAEQRTSLLKVAEWWEQRTILHRAIPGLVTGSLITSVIFTIVGAVAKLSGVFP